MVNDLIESRAALNSNLFGMMKGRKGFMGESRLHGYPSLRFNADQAVDQSVIRPDHHGYYHQASDLAVSHENENPNAHWHSTRFGNQWHKFPPLFQDMYLVLLCLIRGGIVEPALTWRFNVECPR